MKTEKEAHEEQVNLAEVSTKVGQDEKRAKKIQNPEKAFMHQMRNTEMQKKNPKTNEQNSFYMSLLRFKNREKENFSSSSWKQRHSWFWTYFKMAVGQSEALLLNVVPHLRRQNSTYPTSATDQWPYVVFKIIIFYNMSLICLRDTDNELVSTAVDVEVGDRCS